jgi:cysteine-rich repeat protein
MLKANSVLAVIALSQSLLASAFAAQQLVTTKTLLVKNPPSGARKVLWKVKETAAIIAGDPTANGATLHIQLTPGGDQCVAMPASGWAPIGTIGFKYKDATLASGPVKVAQIKKTPSGTFLIKVLLKNGGPASIGVAPGNPTASYATNFTLGTGDEYCGGTAEATPNPNDENTFKVSGDAAPSGCLSSCGATTTSTSVTTTSTGTITTTSTTLGGGVCGDAIRQAGEQCDDGNLTNLDGCDSSCLFEQSHRINNLQARFGTDTSCLQNAFGGAFGSLAQGPIQTGIDSSIADGSTSVLLHFRGLDDLGGTSDAAVQVGVLAGTPVAGAGYDGTNDVDWWYTADLLDLDANRLPLSVLPGNMTAKILTAGPGNAEITLPWAGTLADLAMSSLVLKILNGEATTPLGSLGGPPGHLAAEHLDPALQSWETAGAGGSGTMCGNISAASLSQTPIPSTILSNCSTYSIANSLLDLLVGGCTVVLLPVVHPTQPDAQDPGVAPVGSGPPYTLASTLPTHVVNVCRDSSNAIVSLSACLADAAYSSYFRFATDRVIIK